MINRERSKKINCFLKVASIGLVGIGLSILSLNSVLRKEFKSDFGIY